jgi:hypothetical protein
VGETEVAIHGVGLDGDVSLGDGIEIERRAATPDTVWRSRARSRLAAVGARAVKVGKTEVRVCSRSTTRRLPAVEPPYAIARVGVGRHAASGAGAVRRDRLSRRP